MLLLMILDGWGIAARQEACALNAAKTPNMDSFFKKYPNTSLACSGEAVGLPEGQMGNSEVGHLNMGAGRIVYQELTRITKEIKEGTFFKNEVLLNAIKKAKENNSALHLIGLLSDGGVHSHIKHLYGFLELAKSEGLTRVFVHALLDGRDVPPRCAQKYFDQLEHKMQELGIGKIASISGRYYGMDRDNRWERVQKAYDMYSAGEGLKASSAKQALKDAYERGENDEFVMPTLIDPEGVIKDNDSVIFFNFRPDRAREITRCFVDREFKSFKRKAWPKVHYVCTTQYDKTIKAPVAFAPQKLVNVLAEVLSKNGKKQLHIAETEKYAHVTFFFNGGVEKPYAGEDRTLIPSPKVATYDMQPEMSAFLVTEAVLEDIEAKKHDFIVLNFANADMVGHTGVFEAAVKAAEAVDECVGKIVKAVQAIGGEVLITADHGNSDEMLDENKGVVTAHTTNPVPFIYIGREKAVKLKKNGTLANISPTVLKQMGIAQPKEMDQEPLF
ncbi:2,3-bisphosphoglycerate-independent phosphoglycerate mutase [Candidatus Margulisiibacteriota bacterium]